MAKHNNRQNRETCAERHQRLRETRKALFDALNILHAKCLIATSTGRFKQSQYIVTYRLYNMAIRQLLISNTRASRPLGIRLRYATHIVSVLSELLAGKVFFGTEYELIRNKRSNAPILKRKRDDRVLDLASREYWQRELKRLTALGQDSTPWRKV